MDEGEGSGTTGSEVSMSLPNLLLGILWSPYAKIHLGLLVGVQFYGEYNGKQSILVLRSYYAAITLLHFTGIFWSSCRHSYSLVDSDFVPHLALGFGEESLCK